MTKIGEIVIAMKNKQRCNFLWTYLPNINLKNHVYPPNESYNQNRVYYKINWTQVEVPSSLVGRDQ